MTDNTSNASLLNSGTLLVVEDRADLLRLIKDSLEGVGYKVLAATNPNDALLLSKTYTGIIHLLLTDVIMQDMNGKQLSDCIVKTRPGIKVLFMSGYTENDLAPRGVINKGIHFLQKPFSLDELENRICRLLSLSSIE